MRPPLDSKVFVGAKFHRLTVTGALHRLPGKAYESVLVTCDCGVVKTVAATSLTSGHSKSCGCFLRERARDFHCKHGNSGRGNRSPEYTTWSSLRSRCLDKDSQSFKNYGGRGISVCSEWADFNVFLSDMGVKPSPDHSIDRIDVNGNYEPSNCRWATQKEQARNKRGNRLIEFNGVTKCAAEWSEETGIKAYVIGIRIRSGWTPEKALSSPVESRTKKSLVTRGPSSKLNEEIIREILASNDSQKAIAARFGIDPSSVSLIKSRKVWAHVLFEGSAKK